MDPVSGKPVGRIRERSREPSAPWPVWANPKKGAILVTITLPGNVRIVPGTSYIIIHCFEFGSERVKENQMIKNISIFLLLFFVGAGISFGGGDAEKGKPLYAICIACHGANGEGNLALNSPSIAGQEEWYLIRQLKHFKEGIRGADPKDIYGMQMRPMAMTLTDDASIENVAAYVSSLKPNKPAKTVNGDAAKGKTLYTLCATCHGPDGKGMQAMNGPNMTIQQDWYLVRQVKNFKDGIRGTNPKDIFGMQMRPMAMTLADDKAIQDVIAYMTSLAK